MSEEVALTRRADRLIGRTVNVERCRSDFLIIGVNRARAVDEPLPLNWRERWAHLMHRVWR